MYLLNLDGICYYSYVYFEFLEYIKINKFSKKINSYQVDDIFCFFFVLKRVQCILIGQYF